MSVIIEDVKHELALRILVRVSIVAAPAVPAISYYALGFVEGSHEENLVFFVPPIIWLVLVLFTLAYSGWQKRIYKLLALIPVAFVIPIFIGWFYVAYRGGGFAP